MKISALKSIVILFIGWIYYQYLLMLGIQSNVSDFSVFYASSEALHFNSNPYTSYITLIKNIPNLNPPATLMLFHPMIYLRYDLAIFTWNIVSLLLGGLATLQCFKILLDKSVYDKHRFTFLLVFLVATPTLINFIAAQVAGILFFLMIYGYSRFLENQQVRAGLLWGLAMATKLFPGLILFYAINQKKYQTALIMILTTAVLWFLPVLLYGTEIYHQYCQSLSLIDNAYSNWNVSVYGFINRLVKLSGHWHQDTIKSTLYFVVFTLCIISYLTKLQSMTVNKQPHRGFSFSVVMMLFLAPVVLEYYLMLLIFPLIVVWQACLKSGKRLAFVLWIITLMLLDFATRYRLWTTDPLKALTYHSFYFYGLLILLYMLALDSFYQLKTNTKKMNPSFILLPILAAAFLFINANVLIRLMNGLEAYTHETLSFKLNK